MAHKGYKQTQEHKSKKAASKRRGAYFKCLVCNSEFWRQPAAIKKGDCKFCSRICYQAWQKGKSKNCIPYERNGSRNPNWKGGVDYSNRSIRRSEKYRFWRISVFERDGYACQECGLRGVYLQAHHIKPFSLYPDLRLDISNGITLCKSCHYKKPKGKELCRQK